MDIILKNTSVLRGLMERRYSPLLVDIDCYIAETYGFLMTESYREKTHGDDLHGTIPVRATDKRERCYPIGLARKIADDVNGKWQYDPTRPDMKVIVIHENRSGNGGVHLHTQVHPRTIRRFV